MLTAVKRQCISEALTDNNGQYDESDDTHDDHHLLKKNRVVIIKLKEFQALCIIISQLKLYAHL